MEVTDSLTRGVLIGQKRYEGYCIDLINEIAKVLHFKGVEFEIVTDKQGKYEPKTKSWNGLIKRIIDKVSKMFQRKFILNLFLLPFLSILNKKILLQKTISFIIKQKHIAYHLSYYKLIVVFSKMRIIHFLSKIYVNCSTVMKLAPKYKKNKVSSSFNCSSFAHFEFPFAHF